MAGSREQSNGYALKRYSGMVKPEDEAEFSKMFAHAYSLYSEQRVLGPSVRYSMVEN